MTTDLDPRETLLRVAALNLRKDELQARARALSARTAADPSFAPEALPQMQAINAELDLLISNANDMRREQIEHGLRRLDAAKRPWWERLIPWR